MQRGVADLKSTEADKHFISFARVSSPVDASDRARITSRAIKGVQGR